MEATGKAEYLIQQSGCGPFQIWIVLIAYGLMKIPTLFTMMFMSFGNYNPGWRCLDNHTVAISDNDTDLMDMYLLKGMGYNESNTDLSLRNNTLSSSNRKLEYIIGSCPEFTACQNVEFDPAVSTIVTEWGLLCDKNWISSLIISIQMAGLLVGSFASGYLGDTFGRKRVLLLAVGIDGVFHVIAAFMTSWKMFAAIRFLMGLVLAVIVTQHGILVSEFLNTKWRGRFYPIPMWPICSVLMSVIVMICKDWKYFHIITGCGCFLCFLIGLWLPESLRWLEVKGRDKQFSKVALKMISMSKTSVSIELADLKRMSLDNDLIEKDKPKVKKCTLLDIFRKGYRLYSVIVGFYWMSASLIYYAISFGVKALSGNFFVNLILMSVIEIVFSIIPVLAPNLIGRKKSSMILMIFGAVCLVTIAVFEVGISGSVRNVGTLVLALTAKSLVNGSWNVVSLFTNEIYPTLVRSIGMNYGTTMARIGGMLAPFLIPSDAASVYICYIVMGILGFLCSVLITLLPETKGKPLKETFDDE